MNQRSSFILLLEHVHTMEELTDEEFGKFVRAYASYIETGVEPNFDDRSMRLMWKTVKAFDDMNCEKYESTSAARREAGKRGALKRWAQDGKGIASDNKNSKCHFANSKNALSVSDSESDSVSINNIGASALTPPTKSTRFHPPDMDELKAYFAEKGGTDAQAERFLDFYESNGWKVGKNPMKSWKAAASGWIARDKERQRPVSAPRNKAFLATRPPEEAEKAGDFLKNAAHRRSLKKKGDAQSA